MRGEIPAQGRPTGDDGEQGFLLVALVVTIFLILLALSVAAPRVAMQMKREREVESEHRAKQYVRAIRLYYKKFQRYPASMDQLKKTNNIRFLRQEYVDPLTGKSDWRLIQVGSNKTKVKGFFGEDLPGLMGGLGAAAGTSSNSGSGIFGASGAGTGGGAVSGASAAIGSAGANTTGNSTGTNTTGTNTSGATGTGSAFGSSSTTGFGSNSGNSQDVSSLGGSTGPFMGVGSAKSGEAILVVNEQANYEDWEFLYDPRIEQMYAKATLLGGMSSGLSSGSLGSLGGSTSSGQGGTGTTTAPGIFGTPSPPTTPATPTTPAPQ